ncbi:HlyD family type I secretion periplasmic adaptor subunit [Paramagnetospirillum kuznetsovii]|uniref:Membrane fusion protein (MFP) family protein n=1 Tax=Paramagnetospirillum kuznetsovii TaxID=2053833 RepID=A0A364P1W3_9PROT|nr:HlyD family type I secretion periplasmic adaptor subunit [Paramagnetospirillum kuznetsovii]RAU23286.1 HlyD family type I secretion periplasmic adaptor subunit [Paramagnetospirillum kuznetsovii]
MLERLRRLIPMEGEEEAGSRLFILCATAMVVIFLLWASLGRLDVVARAGGEVIPYSQVKSIQHLEGGIVSEIMVREGDRVSRNQPLVGLQSTSADTQVDELSVRLTSLKLDILRLQTEAGGAPDLVPPADLARDHPSETRQALALLQSRRERHLNALASQQQAIAQREQSLNEISARLRNTRNSLKLIEEQVGISEELLKDQLTNRYNHLALLRDQSALRSRIEEDTATARRAESAISEAKSQIDGIRHAYDQEVKEHLAAAQREYDELMQRLRRLSDSQSRTILRSPVDGVVKTLRVATAGGVIKAGDTVLDIVPEGDRLIVEARLPVYDVGHVRVGQPAKIRLASNEGTRFGTIDGSVVHISADTLVTDRGAAYYKVRIETESDQFRSGDLSYRLYPGIQVEANIVTGSRTVLQYLLDPFLGYADQALRER